MCLSLVWLKNTPMFSVANKAFNFFSSALVDRHKINRGEMSHKEILKLRGEQIKGGFDGLSKFCLTFRAVWVVPWDIYFQGEWFLAKVISICAWLFRSVKSSWFCRKQPSLKDWKWNFRPQTIFPSWFFKVSFSDNGPFPRMEEVNVWICNCKNSDLRLDHIWHECFN